MDVLRAKSSPHMSSDKFQVVCFGEVLWDLLPSGKIAGGAPMNVAFHLNQLGAPAAMVSRVGSDDLGREILAFLAGKNIDTSLIQRDDTFPTGIVKVALDEQGHPSYEIVQPVAWDFIRAEPAALDTVENAAMLVFGSLAARNRTSRETLMALLERAVYRVFDVNLRPPFFSPELLEELLGKADLLKMNDHELDTLSGWYHFRGEEKDRMESLLEHFHLDGVVVTKGDKGAVFQDKSGFYLHAGYPVQVQDTIGSGDAFLAGFLRQTLRGEKPDERLAFACSMGAFVATQKGGTPQINPEKIHFDSKK